MLPTCLPPRRKRRRRSETSVAHRAKHVASFVSVERRVALHSSRRWTFRWSPNRQPDVCLSTSRKSANRSPRLLDFAHLVRIPLAVLSRLVNQCRSEQLRGIELAHGEAVEPCLPTTGSALDAHPHAVPLAEFDAI